MLKYLKRSVRIFSCPEVRIRINHVPDKTGPTVLGRLKRTFTYWTEEPTKPLYTTFVGSHLEYASSAWNPYRAKDIKIIEQVQRRATKLANLRTLSYSDRLAKLGLTTLKLRRERGDAIQFFKTSDWLNIAEFKRSNCPAPSITSTGPAKSIRWNKYRLNRQLVKGCDQRELFFTNRVVPLWNALPEEVVNAHSVKHFKMLFDEYFSSSQKTAPQI